MREGEDSTVMVQTNIDIDTSLSASDSMYLIQSSNFLALQCHCHQAVTVSENSTSRDMTPCLSVCLCVVQQVSAGGHTNWQTSTALWDITALYITALTVYDLFYNNHAKTRCSILLIY